MNKIERRKAVIVGCGFVGSATAFALMESGLFSDLALIDANREKAEGEALDIGHGLPFAQPMQIYAGDYGAVDDADIVVVTAGAGQKPGESRLDLVRKNVEIFSQIIPQIAARNFNGVLLIVANPVDILTAAALRFSGLPEHRVIGSGTVLDTARLKYLLGQHLGVDSRNVHAFIIGEHGDSEFVPWSCVNVSGVELPRFCEMRGHFHHQEAMDQIAEEVRGSAYRIIEKKKATYYGIAMSVRRICQAIMRDEKSILPVSALQHGAYGVEGLCLSMPVIVGAGGTEGMVPLHLNLMEQEQLRHSAETLRQVMDSVPELRG